MEPGRVQQEKLEDNDLRLYPLVLFHYITELRNNGYTYISIEPHKTYIDIEAKGKTRKDTQFVKIVIKTDVIEVHGSSRLGDSVHETFEHWYEDKKIHQFSKHDFIN